MPSGKRRPKTRACMYDLSVRALTVAMTLTSKQMGKGGHVLTFPVNHGKTLNVVAFHTTSSDWPDSSRLVAKATREDALRDFAGFGDTVTSLLKLAAPSLETVSTVCQVDLQRSANTISNN